LAEFHNPQQEPGTERRLLLVFAVTFLIILAFQPLLKKYLPQPPAKTEQPAVETHTSQPSAAETVSPAIVPPAGTRQASTEAETVIENDLYKIRFSNRGAQVKSWILKKFTDDNDRPLELVSPLASERYGYPLSLWSYDETLRNKLNTALYVSTAGQNSLSAPADITFEYSDPEIAVRKTFRFDHTYVVKVETSVVQKGAVVSAFPMWPAGFGDETTPAAFAASRIEYQNNGAIERLAIKKVSGGGTVQGPFQWAGVTDQYFAAVFVPDEPQNVALVTLNNPLDVPKDWKKPDPKETVRVEVLGAAVGNLHGPTVARLFVGPKALDVVEAVAVPTISSEHQDLRSLVDFGWLGLIARPLFLWLKWTYNHIVPN